MRLAMSGKFQKRPWKSIGEEGYIRGDPFGQGGLELQYEQDVRGTPGSEFKMINIKGQVVADYLEGQENRAAQSGMDLTLTIDADLQAFAESLFVNKRGGVYSDRSFQWRGPGHAFGARLRPRDVYGTIRPGQSGIVSGRIQTGLYLIE